MSTGHSGIGLQDQSEQPIRVFLTGGEGIGWALDDDLDMTQRALQSLAGLVELSSLEECDVVHSVYAPALTALEGWQLTGKRVVCQVDNDVFWLLQQPYMRQARGIVRLWIAQNSKACRQMTSLGIPVQLVPYAVDTASFQPKLPGNLSVALLKAKWQIPDDRFVIGSFVRDTLGTDLTQPKEQKGADVFLAIVRVLHAQNLPIHVLLAGPRRHWLRAGLEEHGIPFTYIGKVIEGDDIGINILDKQTLSLLYYVLDLYVVTSRWEGGPRAVLEAGATRCRIISTPVGLSSDVLEPECIFRTVDQGIELIEREIHQPFLTRTLDKHYDRVVRNHTPEANAPRFRQLYERIAEIPIYQPAPYTKTATTFKVPSRVSLLARKAARRLSRTLGLPERSRQELCVSLWHEFHKPPYGGGNQFMMALKAALEGLGATVYPNRLSPDVDVHVCNSSWFDVARFSAYARHHRPRMLHRVDGPISLYRSTDRSLDDQVFELNARFASATILQSAWSYERLAEMGYRPVKPIIIRNAVDGRIFHPNGRLAFDRHRKVRLISTSWSDNPRKGGPIYKWLEEHLDWDRFEYTFVGRTQEHFSRIRHIPPLPSERLAEILRQHDIYITASQNDPCSNALIEALACGLPALYLDDGGHSELVSQGGLPFRTKEEILLQLEKLVEYYELFQRLIVVQSIETVAKTYLEIAREVLAAENDPSG